MAYIFRFSAPKDGYGSNVHLFSADNLQNAVTAEENCIQGGQEHERSCQMKNSKTFSLITGCSFLANLIMKQAESGRQYFNDFNFYDDLCQKDDCTKVDIASIRARHNDFCHGFQVQYRTRSQNGSTQLVWAKKHFFQHGFYSYHGGRPKEQTWILDEDEYITGLRIHQGEIVDGITFVTNHREFHSGGRGGDSRDMMLSNICKAQHRIVAFTGTENGILQRVGYYAKPFGWSIVRDFILLRCLQNNGRAIAIDSGEKNIMHAFIGLAEDGIFRCILEYLVFV
eukprot:CAMPEP_0194121990 /NCGR_PEP_ID=MMETSP0150-20130528/48903_1 /TAXON_ID=122233 /ORGANISM="Chaetoceros debilis, Strain MM31A-1" /LENGTH=282 /DNA_ID=CAMNT_0038814653 /DNA_START=61 /DNA_END=909 /DNA_ORIENTATION=+